MQGVGFRPAVWRLARELGLAGDVRNDGAGVLIRLFGDEATRDTFCRRLAAECPPLARIQSLERTVLGSEHQECRSLGSGPDDAFRIVASEARHRSLIPPDRNFLSVKLLHNFEIVYRK